MNPSAILLPIYGQGEPERADAQRNRRLLLSVARRMLEQDGVAALTMDDLAERAGVGIGTVYRRFGDRNGLALALLDHSELEFQAAFLSGPPPLGPGAAPLERLRAFFEAFVDRLEVQADLHRMAECQTVKSGPYASGAYQARRAHILGLLNEAGMGDSSDYLADALLALLSASLYVHQRRDLGLSKQAVLDGIGRIMCGLLFGPTF
ncbi:MAG: TetR/AcrR family transcriptional regulator [Actinomycetota bacterium]